MWPFNKQKKTEDVVEITLSVGAIATLAQAAPSILPGAVVTIKDDDNKKVVIKVKALEVGKEGEIFVNGPMPFPVPVFAGHPVHERIPETPVPHKTPQEAQNELLKPVKDIPAAMQAVGMALTKGWRVRLVQPDTSMLQFAKGDVKVNVYWTSKGNYTVATTLDHPKAGRQQLYRKRISVKELEQLFINPRQHTGKGYREK